MNEACRSGSCCFDCPHRPRVPDKLQKIICSFLISFCIFFVLNEWIDTNNDSPHFCSVRKCRKRSLSDPQSDDLDNTRDSVLSGQSQSFSDNGEPELIIIDFEYCAYNYRGFDLANHFIEWTMDYTNKEFPFYYHKTEQYPTKEQQVCVRQVPNKMSPSLTSIILLLLSGSILCHLLGRIVVQRGLHAIRSRNRWIEKWSCVLHNGLAFVLEPLGICQCLPRHWIRLLGTYYYICITQTKFH